MRSPGFGSSLGIRTQIPSLVLGVLPLNEAGALGNKNTREKGDFVQVCGEK